MATDARERILGRIREALSTKAEPRHLPAVASGLASQKPMDWLPSVPADLEGRITLFEKNSADLKTEFYRCADEKELGLKLKSLSLECGWKSLASHDFSMGNSATASLGLPVLKTDVAYDKFDLERCDAGISCCECLVAQTGGILVTAKSSGGRALSVLPPHHIVIARSSQMVGDLCEAFACVRKSHDGEPPAFLSFITGPSRTGDIERILVLGAHGPKRLTVYMVEK